jgi:hypothetical protein
MRMRRLLLVLVACDMGPKPAPPASKPAAPVVAAPEPPREVLPPLPVTRSPQMIAQAYAEELSKLGVLAEAGLQAKYPSFENGIVAFGACTRPDAKQKQELDDAVWAWITRSLDHVDRANLQTSYGCIEESGVVANVSIDQLGERENNEPRVGHWWVLRVEGGQVGQIIETTGAATDDWMEWVDEHSITANVELDLDRDGRLDVVIAESHHEGGAVKSSYVVSVWLSAQDKIVPITKFYGELSLPAGQPRDGRSLVLAFDRPDVSARKVYRCITPGARMTSCPLANVALQIDDKLDAAGQLHYATQSQLQPLETIARDLVTLEIATAQRDDLLARYPSVPKR